MPKATLDDEAATSLHPPSLAGWGRWGLRLVFFGLLVWTGWEIVRVGLGINSHVVLPGKVYRSAQPDENFLRQMVRDHGLRTVINLRGGSQGGPFFDEEEQACRAL